MLSLLRPDVGAGVLGSDVGGQDQRRGLLCLVVGGVFGPDVEGGGRLALAVEARGGSDVGGRQERRRGVRWLVSLMGGASRCRRWCPWS